MKHTLPAVVRLYQKRCCLTILMGLLCLLPQLAAASPQDWVDKDYDFSKVKTMVVYELDDAAVDIDSDIELKQLQQETIEQAARTKFTLLTVSEVADKISAQEGEAMALLAQNDEARWTELWQQDIGQFADIYVRPQLEEYEIGSYVIPAHIDWETRTETEPYTDRDGRLHTRRRDVSYPVAVPARTVQTATVKIRVDVYDAKTHQAVFSREATRVDDYSDNCVRTYSKLMRSFYNDLRRKAR